ncbi:hypothetical protein ACW9YQ_07620 [Paraburkholderia strydomiana]
MECIVFVLAREPRIAIIYVISGTAGPRPGVAREPDTFLLPALGPHHPADYGAQG